MAQKKNQDRKKKVEAFKQKAQQQAEQQAIPKTQLVPKTEWESTEILEFRGDLLHALEQMMVETYDHLRMANEAFSKTGNVLQMLISNNIKKGKIKLTYVWNNGEPATEAEVKEYEDKLAQLRKLQQEQMEKLKAQQNASKTGLVAPDGSPIGTDQDLDEGTEVDFEEVNVGTDPVADTVETDLEDVE